MDDAAMDDVEPACAISGRCEPRPECADERAAMCRHCGGWRYRDSPYPGNWGTEPMTEGTRQPRQKETQMERCADCRFFEASDYPGFGSCTRWRRGYATPVAELASNECLVENDEGWANVVGPDFGCRLHEPAQAGEPAEQPAAKQTGDRA